MPWSIRRTFPVKGYDVLDGDHCGSGTPLPGVMGKPAQGRCGYGTRLPFLVVSPYAKVNYVDHTLIDQSSVTRFIEDNWLGGGASARARSTRSPAPSTACSTGRRATRRS